LGRFNFHFNRQTLSVGKEERKLSFRESELLKILIENRDKIIDRKDILNLLWAMIPSLIAVTWTFISPSCVVILGMMIRWK